MEINRVFFSPTETTERVLSELTKSFDKSSVTDVNCTVVKKMNVDDFNPKAELTYIAAPVYAGRVPELFVERFSAFAGNNQNAVIVSVYGNRGYKDALLELKSLAEKQGFNVVAAVAAIGEHSFSSSEFPVAKYRPDSDDAKVLHSFAEQIEKSCVANPEKSNVLQVPGNFPYKQGFQGWGVSPSVNIAMCEGCCTCVDVCPSGHIDYPDKHDCILCFACVFRCPQSIRAFNDEKIDAIRTSLFEKCAQRRKPELFL